MRSRSVDTQDDDVQLAYIIRVYSNKSGKLIAEYIVGSVDFVEGYYSGRTASARVIRKVVDDAPVYLQRRHLRLV